MKPEGKERTGGTEERRATTVVRLEGKAAFASTRKTGRRRASPLSAERLFQWATAVFQGCVCVCACGCVHARARGYSIYSSLSVIEFLKVWLTRNHDTKHFSLSLSLSPCFTHSHRVTRVRPMACPAQSSHSHTRAGRTTAAADGAAR